MHKRSREMQILIRTSFVNYVRALECYASLPMQTIDPQQQGIGPIVSNAPSNAPAYAFFS